MSPPLFPTLLPRVDVNREIQRMSSKELGESLTVTGKELQSLLSHDRVIGEEVMKYAVVAWRPGSSDGDAAGRHCGQRGGGSAGATGGRDTAVGETGLPFR
eukprot:s6484_g2.t1